MIAAGIRRVWNAPTAWTWGFQFLRIAQGIILLPLLSKVLPTADFAMNYLLLALYQLTFNLDMVFGPTLTRMFGYAVSGAKELKAHGLAEAASEKREPNFQLMGQVLKNTIRLYRYILLFLIIGLGIYGSWVVSGAVGETSSPRKSWLAWFCLLAAAPLEFYTSAWLVFLRGMNDVLLAARLQTSVYFVKLMVSVALLLLGFGLLSIPMSTFMTAFVQRWITRRATLRRLPRQIFEAPDKNLFPVIWPTAWRTMVQTIAAYLLMSSMPAMLNRFFGASAQARYSLSMQLIGVLLGFATSWVAVKWPAIVHLRARHDAGGLRAVMWSRLWLQWGTFAVGMVVLITLGPIMLPLVGIEKTLFPRPLLALLGVWIFLDMNFITWTTFLSTENRIPSLWSVTFGYLLSIALALALTRWTNLGVAGVILGPMIIGALFNYWYWPHAGAQNIDLSWWRMMFERPKRN